MRGCDNNLLIKAKINERFIHRLHRWEEIRVELGVLTFEHFIAYQYASDSCLREMGLKPLLDPTLCLARISHVFEVLVAQANDEVYVTVGECREDDGICVVEFNSADVERS